MKNIFWFDLEPADERERTLFMNAYRRAARFLWTVLGILAVLVIFLPSDQTVSVDIVFVAVLLLEIGSISVGWLELRGHELQMKRRSARPPSPVLRMYFEWLFAILLIGLFWIMVIPSHLLLAWAVLSIVVTALGIVLAWRALHEHPLYVRLPLCVLGRELVIGYLSVKRWRVWVRALAAFGVSSASVLMIIAAVFISMLFVQARIIRTDFFEPELAKGSYVLIDTQRTDLRPGEFVVVHGWEKDLVGRFEGMEQGTWMVETAQGVESFSRDEMVGEVIREFPMKWLVQPSTELEGIEAQ